MVGQLIGLMVECGPGKVLAGLVKRIDPELAGLAMFDLASVADVKNKVVEVIL